MSGADVPYHLRPNKYVDRQIFIDVLQRISQTRSLASHIYMSMGGKFLEDHKSMMLALELSGSRSIDGDDLTVGRQNFNKPSDAIFCEHKTSSQFAQEYSGISSSFPDDSHFIVWLDYTNPSERLEQLQEFEKIISHSTEFDIVRITLNANVATVGDPSTRVPSGFATMQDWRLQRYKSVVGQYAGNVDRNDMTRELFPTALAKAVGQAAKKGARATQGLVARPLSVTQYSDGPHVMLSTTLILLNASAADEFMRSPSIANWSFLARDWDDSSLIDVPDLSMREKIYIDRLLAVANDQQIHCSLGFVFDRDTAKSEQKITQYRKHFRFYPQFVRAFV